MICMFEFKCERKMVDYLCVVMRNEKFNYMSVGNCMIEYN
jgi:hypothetical protein